MTIALENTLLRDVEDELTYRLSLRGAALLASMRNPAEVRAQLETMYWVRSKIVHEGMSLADKDVIKKIGRISSTAQPLEFPQSCEETVRQVVREYVLRIAQGGTVEEINRELDALITARLAATCGAASA